MKTSPNSGQQNPRTAQSVGTSPTGSDADILKSFASYREARARRAAAKVSGHAVAVGVYSIKAAEPCHLVELQLEGVGPGLDFGGFTQPAAGQPQAVWQVPWMEVVLNSTGTKVVADSVAIDKHPEMLLGNVRVAFFMHYLDLGRPLTSQLGEIPLPQPTSKPSRLKVIKYEPPD
jgi:hypothetical protein